MLSPQGLTLRPARLPGASKSMVGASRNLILLAPQSIKFNPKSVKFNHFVCICGEKIQFCLDDSDFSNFGQVSQNLNVKPCNVGKNPHFTEW